MMYVRVRDKDTKHEFDLPEGHVWITEGSVELVSKKAYPPSEVVRPPRHFVRLRSSEPETVSLTESGGASSISKENR